MALRIVEEKDLVPDTCDVCGEGNALVGAKKGCPDCLALIKACVAATGRGFPGFSVKV